MSTKTKMIENEEIRRLTEQLSSQANHTRELMRQSEAFDRHHGKKLRSEIKTHVETLQKRIADIRSAINDDGQVAIGATELDVLDHYCSEIEELVATDYKGERA